MSLSRRETSLTVLTLAIVVLGGSFLIGMPLAEKWRAISAQRIRLLQENKTAQRLINRRDQEVETLTALQSQLPKYGKEQPVTAELLKLIKRMADEHQVSLQRTEPDKEKQVGDLSEVAIDCQWEGTLEGLVRFLYAVQMQGAMLDVRQLSVSPAQGAAGRLKGNFTIFCAFKREDPEAAAAPVAAEGAAPVAAP